MSILPTTHSLSFRVADFPLLTDALDYAALGDTGANFFSGRGALADSLSYRRLRDDAVTLAQKLLDAGLRRNDRLAVVADTDAHFLRFFFACLYAGIIPVPLPASATLASHEAYTQQLQRLIEASGARVAVATEGYITYLHEAIEGMDDVRAQAPEAFYNKELPREIDLPQVKPDDIAYLQYTSGSTRFPRGVIITHRSACSNIYAIANHGVGMRPDDRCMSWLPFYHDMGLVGFVLVPVATQTTVDYLDTRAFAMRPRQWLELMAEQKATISFSPSFGYDLCARRLRKGEVAKYDLSHWRVAGIGAEMIRPETLDRFARELEPAGFNASAFLPCYGMAECTLGISFSRLGQGYDTDYIDAEHLADNGEILFKGKEVGSGRGRHFVNCGSPLPGHEIRIFSREGEVLDECQTGVIHVRGPSVMQGYFNDPEETRAVLSEDGWLNTGDIGYIRDRVLTITGRRKDMIIIHGRNIWPEDLEYLGEQVDGIRMGDAVAFSVPDPVGSECCVLMVQTRERDETRRIELIRDISARVQREMNLECHVELVPPRSLPRTSSGKLSRAQARQNYLAALSDDNAAETAEVESLAAVSPDSRSIAAT